MKCDVNTTQKTIKISAPRGELEALRCAINKLLSNTGSEESLETVKVDGADCVFLERQAYVKDNG